MRVDARDARQCPLLLLALSSRAASECCRWHVRRASESKRKQAHVRRASECGSLLMLSMPALLQNVTCTVYEKDAQVLAALVRHALVAHVAQAAIMYRTSTACLYCIPLLCHSPTRPPLLYHSSAVAYVDEVYCSGPCGALLCLSLVPLSCASLLPPHRQGGVDSVSVCVLLAAWWNYVVGAGKARREER